MNSTTESVSIFDIDFPSNYTDQNGYSGSDEDEYSESYDDSYADYDEDDEENYVLSELYGALIRIIVAFVFLAIIHCFEKRACVPGCCCGRCGILMTVNFLENKTSRLMIVCGFVFISIDLFVTIQEISEMVSGLNPFVKLVIKIAFVGFVCMLYIPLFNCISTNDLPRQIIGLVYVLIFAVVQILEITPLPGTLDEIKEDVSVCLRIFYTNAILIGTGAYLSGSFALRIAKLLGGIKEKPDQQEKDFRLKYLKNLLTPANRKVIVPGDTRKTRFMEFIHKKLYQSIPGFRYSLALQISTTVGLVLCYMLFCKLIGEIIELRNILTHFLDAFGDKLDVPFPNVFLMASTYMSRIYSKKPLPKFSFKKADRNLTLAELLHDQVQFICGCMFVAQALTIFFTTLSVPHIMRSYRDNILNVFRSETDGKIIDTRNFSPLSVTVSAMKYCGFQVSHIMWGFFLQTVFFTVVLIFVGEIIYIPIVYGHTEILWTLFDAFMPIIAVVIITMIIQRVLVKFLFLQERGKLLALQNRKGFFLLMYFMFFYNIFTGLFACLVRIVKCTVFGIILFPRLDQSIFPRLFEKYDAGFKAYACLIRLEEIQNNMIALSFLKFFRPPKCKEPSANPGPEPFSDKRDPLLVHQPMDSQTRRKKIARNRWFVAWTLMHNLQLIATRRQGPIPTTADGVATEVDKVTVV